MFGSRFHQLARTSGHDHMTASEASHAAESVLLS
jgi:hypothetical protein